MIPLYNSILCTYDGGVIAEEGGGAAVGAIDPMKIWFKGPSISFTLCLYWYGMPSLVFLSDSRQ